MSDNKEKFEAAEPDELSDEELIDLLTDAQCIDLDGSDGLELRIEINNLISRFKQQQSLLSEQTDLLAKQNELIEWQGKEIERLQAEVDQLRIPID